MSHSVADTIRAGTGGKATSWTEVLGRFGLGARGFVYVMVGALAIKGAWGYGGEAPDKEGAVREIERLPFGNVVLWVVALGLLGYVGWRLAQGVLDADGVGHDRKGLMKRSAAIGSGLAHIGISLAALAAAIHKPSWIAQGGGDASAQDWTAWLLSQPFGRWLVALVGAAVAGVAFYQFYQAISCKFTKHLRGGGLTARQETWSRRIGRAGYAARGVAFALIAWFLLMAGWNSDAGEAGGLAAALGTLAQQPYGKWLLTATGGGFAMFGIYSIVEARYRRIG